MGCQPDVHWDTTSGNAVVDELVSQANDETLEDVYALLGPDGTVEKPLDPGIVFPDLVVHDDAVWSMLYLAGYRDPVSNREWGSNRPDIRLEPDPAQHARGPSPIKKVRPMLAGGYKWASHACLDARFRPMTPA